MERADQLERDHAELLAGISMPVATEVLPGNRAAMLAYTAVDDCHRQDGFCWSDAIAVLHGFYALDLDPELHIKLKICAREHGRIIAEEVKESIKRASRK